MAEGEVLDDWLCVVFLVISRQIEFDASSGDRGSLNQFDSHRLEFAGRDLDRLSTPSQPWHSLAIDHELIKLDPASRETG